MAAARCSRRMTLGELSERAGITPSSLSRVESGLRVPTIEEIDRIATALQYPPNAFSEPLPAAALGLPGFYHRKFSRAGIREVRRIEGLCLMAAIGLRRLVRLVEVDTPHQLPLIDLEEYRGDVERAAEALRMSWQLPRGPIANLAAVIERAGGLIVHFDFEVEAMDAMYQVVPGMPAVFWVNSRKPVDRVRFSLAHELAHAVLHHSPTEPSEAEHQADALAGAFLMPAAEFRRECPTHLRLHDLAQLKRRWRVSMAAIARRARDIGRITETQCQSLRVQMSRNGWRKFEPVELQPEAPSLLPELLKKCMQECGFDRAELADALRVPQGMVRDWEQLWPGRDEGGDGPRLRLVV